MRATKTGVGRLSQDQVMGIGKDDIRAISKYLGNKKFMHGDNITLVSSLFVNPVIVKCLFMENSSEW